LFISHSKIKFPPDLVKSKICLISNRCETSNRSYFLKMFEDQIKKIHLNRYTLTCIPKENTKNK